MVRPRKLVTPVPDKVQYTHQAKVNTDSQTHCPTAKANIANAAKKAESDPRITNRDHHNQS